MPRSARDIYDEHTQVKNLIKRLESEYTLDESDLLHLRILYSRKRLLKETLNSRYGEIKCASLN